MTRSGYSGINPLEESVAAVPELVRVQDGDDEVDVHRSGDGDGRGEAGRRQRWDPTLRPPGRPGRRLPFGHLDKLDHR